MLGLFSFVSVADSVYFAGLFFDNPDGDLGKFLGPASIQPWYITVSAVCNALVILLGDGILVSIP